MVHPKPGADLGAIIMPVIRGRSSEKKLTDEQRGLLLSRLADERQGLSTQGGPVIFEIPLEQSDKLDVMVVWDAWQGVRSEDRTRLIQEAYREQQDSLALALGVTYEEAIEQGLLPFRVRPRTRQQVDFREEDLRSASLSVGGFERPDNVIELRYPSRTVAEETIRRLEELLPGTEWAVSYADV